MPQQQKLYYTKYFCPQTLQIIIGAEFSGKKIQTIEYNKKYDPVSLVTQKGVLNRSNSILKYITAGTNLNGITQSQTLELNTWYEFFNTQLYPLLGQLYGQIFGDKQSDEKKYNYCLTEINKNLKILDDVLKIRTFFVGHNITTFDITLVCYLQTLFKLIITEAERKKLLNLTRWYNYLREIPVITKIYGKKILCGKDSFKIDFKIQTKQEVKTEQKSEVKKQQKQPKRQSKKQAKQQQKTQVKPSSSVEKEPANAQGTTKPAQDNFKLDDWKRQFQNSENQNEVIKNLLDNFNNQNWSIWKIHYLKDVTQGKVLFLTQNLANGTLQRLEGLRKTGFGTWGVYGQEGDYEIRGVMMWKGTEINPAWKQHPSYEYHKFDRLNPSDQNDRQIIFDYWMERECAQGLMLRSTKRLV